MWHWQAEFLPHRVWPSAICAWDYFYDGINKRHSSDKYLPPNLSSNVQSQGNFSNGASYYHLIPAIILTIERGKIMQQFWTRWRFRRSWFQLYSRSPKRSHLIAWPPALLLHIASIRATYSSKALALIRAEEIKRYFCSQFREIMRPPVIIVYYYYFPKNKRLLACDGGR